jgi:GMP synthase (glutamine-hydrolysing)
VKRYGARLIREGFFLDGPARDAYTADLQTLEREPDNKPIAWRYGFDDTVLDTRVRTTELANWITHQVVPRRASRGRS